MSQRIYTFSVSEKEEKDVALVDKIKKKCKQTGQSFSWVVLKALRDTQDG